MFGAFTGKGWIFLQFARRNPGRIFKNGSENPTSIFIQVFFFWDKNNSHHLHQHVMVSYLLCVALFSYCPDGTLPLLLPSQANVVPHAPTGREVLWKQSVIWKVRKAMLQRQVCVPPPTSPFVGCGGGQGSANSIWKACCFFWNGGACRDSHHSGEEAANVVENCRNWREIMPRV